MKTGVKIKVFPDKKSIELVPSRRGLPEKLGRFSRTQQGQAETCIV